MAAILINFSGRPGSGKTTLSKIIAAQFHATYLRIDTLEGYANNCYGLSNAIARENLLLGNPVVSDGCNYSCTTREGWDQIATETGCAYVNIEVICSDSALRRKRLAERHFDLSPDVIDGIMIEPWENWNAGAKRITIDTVDKTIEECVEVISDAIREKSRTV